MSADVHLCKDPTPRIGCRQAYVAELGHYPVLDIGPISFYPTQAQLEQIVHVIAQYFVDSAAVKNPALDPGGREGEFIVPCQGEPLPVGAATA